MRDTFVVLALLFVAAVLIFFPRSIDSVVKDYRTVTCDVDVSRILDGTPSLAQISCTRTASKCTDISPFVAWGEYTGSLVMQMNGKASTRPIAIGVGLPLVSTRYQLTMCSPADTYTGDVTLFGTSKEVLGKKEFLLT